MTTLTPRQAARRLLELVKGIVGALEEGTDDYADAVIERATREFEQMSLFSKRDAPRLIIDEGNANRTADGIERVIHVRGMAAFVEEGGKTKSHRVAPRQGSVLRFGQLNIFRPQAFHPGSRFEARGFVREAARDEQRGLRRDVDRALRERIRRIGLN